MSKVTQKRLDMKSLFCGMIELSDESLLLTKNFFNMVSYQVIGETIDVLLWGQKIKINANNRNLGFG